MKTIIGIASISVFCLAPASTIRVANTFDLRNRVSELKPGDTMSIAAGNYDVDTWEIGGLSGDSAHWIVFKGDSGTVIRSISGCCNLLQLADVHYLRFEGFELTLAFPDIGVDGINLRGSYSSHIVFENLFINGVGANGISLFPDSAAFITLRNSEIAYAGESGLYWGYPGSSIVHDILVENNYIHHCPADSTSDISYGIQWKGWCYRGKFLNNVLHDVGGTSRCGMVVYYGKKPLAGDNPADVNIVRGNVLWNCRNEGITAMSDAIVENNIVFDAVTGINLQTYGDVSFSGSCAVENIMVRNNTVFRCQDNCVNLSGWGSAGSGAVFTGNVVYQGTATEAAVGGSAGTGTINSNYYFGTSSIANGFVHGAGLSDFAGVSGSAQAPDLNFYPAANSPFVNVLSTPSGFANDDFNTTVRPYDNAADAGAYEWSQAANPGWKISADFKGMDLSIQPALKQNYKLPHGEESVSNIFHGKGMAYFDVCGRRIFPAKKTATGFLISKPAWLADQSKMLTISK